MAASTDVTVPRHSGHATSLLRPGDRLEALQIDRVLGRSPQAVTYLARDDELGPVVVKEFRPDPQVSLDGVATAPATAAMAEDERRGGSMEDDDGGDAAFAAGLAVFRRVGQALLAVRNPGVVCVHRCTEARGTVYLVMEWLEGPTLAEALAAGGNDGFRSEASLRTLMAGILAGLDALHAAGLVHRDIKPQNILLRGDGTPVLLDFDAALPEDMGVRPPYRTLITPGYAAPEQYVRDGYEGPWTDCYGLAALAYRIIAGAPPPDALARVRGGRIAPPAVDVGSGRYSPALLVSIDRALSLDPAERPQTARSWLEKLDRLAGSTSAPAHGRGRHGADQATAPPLAPPEAASPERDDEETASSSGSDGDEGTPTIPIRRMPLPDSGVVAAGTPTAPPEQATGAARRWRGRRRRWLWPIVAFLLLAALPAAVVGGRAYYRTHIKSEWIVDATGGGDAETIAEAMETARIGAIIKVRPGRYDGGLVMDRPLDLRGDGEVADIVVVGSGTAPCLTISAATGTVDGLRFVGEAGSATADGAKGEAGASAEPVTCLEIGGASTVSLTGNIIGNRAGPALRVGGDATPTVRGNRVVETAGAGVVVEDAARGTLTGNEIVASGGAGIVISDTAAPLVSHNRIEGAGQAGILVRGSAGGRLADNVIIDSALSGIEIGGRADPAVVGNRITGSGQAGIYVHDGGRGLFEGNEVASSGFSGVVVGPGASPVLARNMIRSSKQHGILVLAGGRGQYEDNTIIQNGGYGLALDVDATAERSDNTFFANREPQIVIGEAPNPREDGGRTVETPSPGGEDSP